MYPRRKRQRSDEALFLAYRDEQDCQALNDLFRRRVDELLRLAVFLAARPTDAEDLVQATFLTAISKAESFHEGGRVMSWLCGILTNHARMLRRAERESGGEPRDEPIAPSDPANDARAAVEPQTGSPTRVGHCLYILSRSLLVCNSL